MKKIITTSDAPAAIGPYSQAVQAGNLLYISGQIPLDPKTGTLVTDDIAAETRQVFANLKAVLKAGGADFSDVVKVMVFLTDMADFATVNGIYGEYFPENPPARACIQAAALPGGARVEMEAIALVG